MSKKSASSKPVAKNAAPDPNSLQITCHPGDEPDVNAARVLTGPYVTNAQALVKFTKGTVGEMNLTSVVTALHEASGRVGKNDMADVEATLTSQAMALNAIFGDLSRRSALNFSSDYFEAGERYFRMAMKAQNQCRMTLETLSTIKNPPVVYAKQANIANGPQQVNNGTAVPSRAEEKSNSPSKLLEQSSGIPMDSGAPSPASGSHSPMAALDEINRPPND